MTYDYTFKVLLLGDFAVGKTSLIKRYLENQFNPEYFPTLTATISEKKLEFPDFDVRVTVAFWDIGGERRPDEVVREYFLNSHAIIFVYEVTRIASFENIDYWYSTCSRLLDTKPMCYIVGNKIDLEPRVVSPEEAEKKVIELGGKYFETSAKTGFGVQRLFRSVIKDLLKSRLEEIKVKVG